MCGMLIAVSGAALAVTFLLYNIAVMLFGVNMAFTHQYRYAAAESVASQVRAARDFTDSHRLDWRFFSRSRARYSEDSSGWTGVPYAGTMIASGRDVCRAISLVPDCSFR